MEVSVLRGLAMSANVPFHSGLNGGFNRSITRLLYGSGNCIKIQYTGAGLRYM
jgi:hypothetical protein